MKKLCWLVLSLFLAGKASAQYAASDHWYDNPLGFEPLELHARMGFILPFAAVGACLLFTKDDPALTDRLELYEEVGPSWGYKYPHTFLVQNNTGINYLLRPWMSIGIEFSVYSPHDDFNSTVGFGIRPFARFYLFNVPACRLYFESGGGVIAFLTEFPQPTNEDDRLGTQVNGTAKYGLGAEMSLTRTLGLVLGVRHVHVSNANVLGANRNPSHDSNGFYGGLSTKL